MSFGYGWRGPNIVKDGLVLYLDPGSPNSYYDKSGTIIKDISGNGNNGTLINGPTFNSNNGGNITFDGTNQYINVSSITNYLRNVSKFSYSTVIKIKGSGMFFSYGSSNNFANDITFFYDTGNICLQVNNGGDGTASLPYSTNVWLNISVVFDGTQVGNSNRLKCYINGAEQVLSFGYTVPSTTSSTAFLYSWIGAYCTNNSGYLLFDTAITQLYNKALTAQEVLQNYNATKSRFGL